MKTLLFIMACLLGSHTMITAQDFYLPVSSTSETAKAAYYKAEQLASNVKIKEANDQLDKAIEEDPNFFMAYVLKIYYASGDPKAKLIDKALAIEVGDFNEAENIVRQQLVIWDKDPDAKIAENMKALVVAYPQTPQAFHWAALHAAYTDQNADAALKYAEKLANLAPDFPSNYNSMGYMYMEKQQMDKAKAAFERYIKLAPDQANPYDSMGDFYINNKDYANAAKYYGKAAEKGMAGAKERAEKAREMVNQ